MNVHLWWPQVFYFSSKEMVFLCIKVYLCVGLLSLYVYISKSFLGTSTALFVCWFVAFVCSLRDMSCIDVVVAASNCCWIPIWK